LTPCDVFSLCFPFLLWVSELDTVTEERNDVRKTFEELRRQRLEMFMDGFGQITLKLKEMYQMITLGGDAELELVDSLDPFSEGIVFSVRPPKKSWKNISNLSGGEKTLSSLALVFALPALFTSWTIDAARISRTFQLLPTTSGTRKVQFIMFLRNMFELPIVLSGSTRPTMQVVTTPRAGDWSANGLAPATPLAERTTARTGHAAKDL
jgi:structural maintenance of chromosome 4